MSAEEATSRLPLFLLPIRLHGLHVGGLLRGHLINDLGTPRVASDDEVQRLAWVSVLLVGISEHEGTEEGKRPLAPIAWHGNDPQVRPWELTTLVGRVIRPHPFGNTTADLGEKALEIVHETGAVAIVAQTQSSGFRAEREGRLT